MKKATMRLIPTEGYKYCSIEQCRKQNELEERMNAHMLVVGILPREIESKE
jgi:hypothetical protein